MKNLIILLYLVSVASYGQWTPLGDDIDGAMGNDQFGYSVSLSNDGTILAVGAPFNDDNGISSGHVRIFENQSGNWVQLGNTIVGSDNGDKSGFAVSLSGDGQIVAIGAPDEGTTAFEAGQVRVFQYQGGTWEQLGDDIFGEALSDHSGTAISLNNDGTILAIGAPDNEGDAVGNPGHVRVYEFVAGAWEQLGDDIDGEAQEDNSGFSVCLNDAGTLVAIGAPFNDDSAPDAGHVRVYEWDGDNWVQVGDDINGEASNDRFGSSVSFNTTGGMLAVGGIDNNGIGHVRVFRKISDEWIQFGEDIDGIGVNDDFGNSVSLNDDGNILAIGAPLFDGGGNDTGLVQVYRSVLDEWVKVDNDMIGEAQEDRSGYSVSMSADGSIIAAGGYLNDESGANAGHARVWNNATILDLPEEFSSNAINVSPNPVSNHYTILLDRPYDTVELKVFDALQRTISEKLYYNSSELSVNATAYAKGVYFLNLRSQGKSIAMLRIIKN
ncbi:MAG: T9SS type A sorting domain-containing protein [Flavobacteriaceae bacterium]|nr:T9SS type A sorting domain-containing protein [Flavobacteriaceae bacterium]